jgi:hypothetical protein
MANKDYSISFRSSKGPEDIFETLLNVRKWWTGLYAEEITGDSKKLNDEFTFRAGDGVHYTEQRLTELTPNKKITWLVTKSNLSFLEKPDEWTGSKIRFDVSTDNGMSEVTFTHLGLEPTLECYDSCAGAWSKYLEKLSKDLK